MDVGPVGGGDGAGVGELGGGEELEAGAGEGGEGVGVGAGGEGVVVGMAHFGVWCGAGGVGNAERKARELGGESLSLQERVGERGWFLQEDGFEMKRFEFLRE